jgi:hypothetical protein
MPPTPPLTYCELHDMFNRYVADEQIAAIRVAQADYCERMAVQRLDQNRRRAGRMGIIADMEYKP